MTTDATMMLVLLAGACLLGAYGIWQKTRVLGALKVADVGALGGGSRRALRDGLLQRRMMDDPLSAVVHFLIVVGLLLLVPGGVNLIAESFGVRGAVFGGSEAWMGLYALAMEAGALGVFSGAGLGLFRRWMLKPKHVRSALQGEALLSILGFTGICSLLLEGFRAGQVAAVTDPASLESAWTAYGPVARFLGKSLAVAGMGEQQFGGMERLAYWGVVCAVFVLVAAVSKTRLMHAWLSFRTLAHSTHLPGHAVKIVAGAPEGELGGISRFSELTRKQGLDIVACTQCGRCERSCPTALADAKLRPGEWMQCAGSALEKATSAVAGGKEEGAGLLDVCGREALWECTTCRACEESCPIGVQHVGRIVEMRRHLTHVEKAVPEGVAQACKGMEERSNPFGAPRAERGAWAQRLGVARFTKENRPEYLLFLGCYAGHDRSAEAMGTAVVRLLQKGGVSFGVLGPEEGCCGDVALRTGNEQLFRKLARANLATFAEYGLSKVITLCAHGYQVLKNEYSQMGGSLEVQHYTEVLSELVKAGKLGPVGAMNRRLVYHDSCVLGRYNEMYEAPRQLLDAIPGTVRVDIAQSRDASVCCGGGGGAYFAQAQRRLLGGQRWTQLAVAGADAVCTACPVCFSVLEEARNRERSSAEVVDVAVLLARAVFGEEGAKASDQGMKGNEGKAA